MKNKTSAFIILGTVLVLVVMVAIRYSRTSLHASRAAAESAQTAAVPKARSEVVVYYFHGNVRCLRCRRIESLAHAVVTSEFAPQLASGQLQWKVLNVEQPENQHFFTDFKLITWSVVIVRYDNGRQVSYRNLKDVWVLLKDEAAFRKYVKDGIQGALDKG